MTCIHSFEWQNDLRVADVADRLGGDFRDVEPLPTVETLP